MEAILALRTPPRRCVGDGSMVARATLRVQGCLSLKISFPKRLKPTSHMKICIQMKVFLCSGGAFGGHFGAPNRPKTLRQRFPDGSRTHFELRFSIQNAPRRCVSGSPMEAGGILSTQDASKLYQVYCRRFGNASKPLRT